MRGRWLTRADGAHNDSRMNVSLAMTAALYGATVVNHMEVTALTKDARGKLIGAKVKDRLPELDGKASPEFEIRARGVINATGPFCDAIRKLDDPASEGIVAPSLGVHVTLPGYYSPANMGLIDPSTSDGRVIFFLPWQGNTIAGTTDAPTPIARDPVAGEDEIAWILSEISGYLQPDINVRRGDVLAAWAGIRPLVRDPKAKRTEGLVRNHLVSESDSGLITVAGGKWTTYREMAEETVDAAVRAFVPASAAAGGAAAGGGRGGERAAGRGAARRRDLRRQLPDAPRAARGRARLEPHPLHRAHPALRPRDRGGGAPGGRVRRPRVERGGALRADAGADALPRARAPAEPAVPVCGRRGAARRPARVRGPRGRRAGAADEAGLPERAGRAGGAAGRHRHHGRGAAVVRGEARAGVGRHGRVPAEHGAAAGQGRADAAGRGARHGGAVSR